ncbi:phage tail tape measure protein [Neisseria shayeganii]|uniref:Phage tail tape measure protein n=1 Tax=Neisseria shayeganii TaxID=607712 RepID=A0A7D7RM88_9NEIS|nr:phage tail tape measure protein [Neisseria shayeganii]QMT40002.1 phage tail tape measure protein [Neisseria shayeganii]
MSRNIVELIARFRDNASQGLRRLERETQRTAQMQSRAWAQAGRQHQQIYGAYARLGIRSEHQIRREIQQTQAAYNRLSRVGTLSQRELARAAEATRNKIRQLNNELGQGVAQSSRWQRAVGGGRRLVGGAVTAGAALTAGAYVMAQPVRRTMDYDTELRHATNTMYAGKSLAEKQAGMAKIHQSVSAAAHTGGRSREETLAAMNTMAASGTMSDEAVLRLLPTVMRTSAAANADGEQIATLVSKALQAGFTESDIPALLDRAMQSGVDGGFELRDMARWLPQQLAAMKNAGMAPTLDNFSALLNANQLSFMTSGSADEAGNNLVNLLAKINSQETITKARGITINGQKGFDFTKEMNSRQAEGMNSLDALVDIVRELVSKDERSRELAQKLNAAQGDEAKMALLESQKALVDGTAVGQLISDRQALMALLALANNPQAAARLQQGQANAARSVNNAYDFVAQGSGFRVEQSKVTLRDAEYGAFNAATDKLADGTQALSDWARQNPETAQAAVGAGYGAGAIMAGAGLWHTGSMLRSMASGATAASASARAAATATQAAATAQAAAQGSRWSRMMPRGGAFGAMAWATLPLSAMYDVTQWAGERDKYGERAEAIRKHTAWLNPISDYLRGDVEAQALRRRAGMSPDHARAYVDHMRGQGKDPAAGDPEMAQIMAQFGLAVDTYQQAGDQYMQAVADNQTAAQQLNEAAEKVGAAAARMLTAAGTPIPITVTVQNGNIAAYLNQAAARDGRRN